MNPENAPGDPPPEPTSPSLRARVPEHISDGVFSTGVIVMTGPSEFVLDFLQTMGRPQRVAARVVLPHPVMPQFVDALKKNLDIYTNRFGAPPRPPQPATGEGGEAAEVRRPSPQEIYDDLKLPDALLSGAYANGVMISHGAAEFSLDFLTSFFPQSAVSARVFMAAGQIPRLLESMQSAWNGLRNRGAPPQQDTPRPSDPADGGNIAPPQKDAPPEDASDDPPETSGGGGPAA